MNRAPAEAWIREHVEPIGAVTWVRYRRVIPPNQRVGFDDRFQTV